MERKGSTAADTRRQTSNELAASVVKYRLEHLKYLERVLQEKVLWLNTVLIHPRDHNSFSDEKRKDRAKMFFRLGISLGALLEISDGPTYVKALAQLMKEYQYHVKNPNMRGIIYFSKYGGASVSTSTTLTTNDRKASGTSTNAIDDAFVPRVVMVNGAPQYRHLLLPDVNYPLQYMGTLLSLIAVFIQVYEKFCKMQFTSAAISELMLQVDTRFMKDAVNTVINDLQKIAARTLKRTMTAFKRHCRAKGSNTLENVSDSDDSGDENLGSSSASALNLPKDSMQEGDESGDLFVVDGSGDEDDDQQLILDAEDQDLDLEDESSIRARLVLITEKLDAFEQLDNRCAEIAKQVEADHTAVVAHVKVVSMLEEQLRVFDNSIGRASEDPATVLSQSRSMITARIKAAKAQQLHAERVYEDSLNSARSMMKERNSQRSTNTHLANRAAALSSLLPPTNVDDESFAATVVSTTASVSGIAMKRRVSRNASEDFIDL